MMATIFTSQKPFIRCLTDDPTPINIFNIEMSNNIHYPDLSFGFIHFYHKAIDNFYKWTKPYETRQKVFLITQDFEINTETNPSDETATSISLEFNKYLQKDKYGLTPFSSGFMKMWELNAYFDIIKEKDKSLSIYNFGKNNDGSILQCACYLRGKNKNDSYFSTVITNKTNETALTTEYGKNISFNTSPSKNSVDLIICDAEIDVSNIYTQEQNGYKPLIENVFEALNYQKKDGTFIIRVSDTYTQTTAKIIEFVKQFYKKTWICKPLISEAFLTEKYVVFSEFKLAKLDKVDENGLKNVIATIRENADFHVYDVFRDTVLTKKVKDFYIKLNQDCGVSQYVSINKIMTYINGNNFNGADYNDFYNNQVECAKYYGNVFLNDGVRKKIHKELDVICGQSLVVE